MSKFERFEKEKRAILEGFKKGVIILTRKKLMKRVNWCGIEDKAGVYIIYGVIHGKRQLLYIGKAGEILNSGDVKYRLKKRISSAPRKGCSLGKQYYNKLVKRFNKIEIEWYVTFDEDKKYNVIPVKVEADLIQAYYDIFNCLPPENKEF